MPDASRQASKNSAPNLIRRRDASSAAANWKKGQAESLAEEAALMINRQDQLPAWFASFGFRGSRC
jgi:hypothetical protein